MQEMNTTSEKIMKLLSEIKPIIATNTESRKKTDASFNIFQICKVDHYETIHSAIIAEFVNPAFLANYYKKPDVFAGECATYITDYFGMENHAGNSIMKTVKITYNKVNSNRVCKL